MSDEFSAGGKNCPPIFHRSPLTARYSPLTTMRPLADAACELPWLAPCAGSLVALTKQPSSSLWPALRGDPGLVLLLLRCSAGREPARTCGATPTHSSYIALLRDPGVLGLALECLDQPQPAFVDWHHASLLPIYRAALACAQAAEAIAKQSDRADPEHAWVGGLLAPLGWLAAAVCGDTAAARLSTPVPEPAKVQRRLWGLDAPAIARRLAAIWRLPAWISAVTGHLGLPLEAARGLGAEPDHFLVVQLAVGLVEQAGLGLQLPVGSQCEELGHALDLAPRTFQAVIDGLKESVPSLLPPKDWEAPARLPLLPDLLRLAQENRRITRAAERDRLHGEVDALHQAVSEQRAGERQRLQTLKLRALAELAAGAGHEINNPLAVISGQAQYLLVNEQEPARRKALQTIVGQTQRIHQNLTQLMQFARPSVPQKQHVDLGGLLSEVVSNLQGLADERQVRLIAAEPPPALTLLVDPGQIRTALGGLLRNAIEAAPASGWASLRVQQDARAGVMLMVEDNGPGPTAADCEHLFDPFYSGRKAGRGRGLGLPTAWQLARQHGGDVRFDATTNGPTRFLLSLPPEAIAPPVAHLTERNGVNGSPSPVARSA